MELDFCVCCGKEGVELYQHHLIPKSIKPNDKTVTLCGECHAWVHNKVKTADIKKLTKRALDKRKKEGKVTNHLKYGWKRDGDFVVENSEEQIVIQKVLDYYKAGFCMSKIAHSLEAQGIFTRTGRPWGWHQLHRIIEQNKNRNKGRKRKQKINDVLQT